MSSSFLKKVLFALCLALVSVVASAQEGGVDYSTITGSIDWSSVTTGVLAIGAALVGVLVAKRGVRLLLSMVGH